MERTGQNGREVDYGVNLMRLEQPRYVVFKPQITPYDIVGHFGIHIDRQDHLVLDSQEATDFAPNVPACARYNDEPVIAS
jgi:hypothetical protein